MMHAYVGVTLALGNPNYGSFDRMNFVFGK